MTTRIAPGVGANLLGQHAAERNQDATAYVGNLDPQISEELLWELFVQAGPVVNVYVPKDRVTNQHQGYGFVEFRSEEDADYAIKVLNMIKLYGKPIRVNKASQDKKSLDVGANLFIGNLDPDVDDNLNQIQDLYMSVTKLYTKSSTTSTVELPPPISASEALIVNALCALGLAFAFWIANTVYSIELVTHPSLTLFFIWITELPIVTLLYSRYRQNRKQCTYLRAVGRGVLGVPVGALLNFLGAIAVGAPVTFQYLPKTVNWALMMSVFTTIPASCVLGSSWADWRRIFAQTKPKGSIEYLICLPAHGAVIGAWFGAWPMPLDWERPWQEWPISVSYGTVAGYLVALVASLGFVLACGRSQHIKRE